MKKKIFLIISLIIGIMSLFIGSYAYYRISITNNINAKSGNATFILKDSNNNDLNNKVITLNDGNQVFPGDSGSFTITLDASGSSVDMYATLEIDRENLPTNLKFYTTSDKKSELHKYYSFLEKNKTNSETLTIYWYWNPYIDDIEDGKFVNKSNLEATIKVSAVQISKYATMKNGSINNTEFWSEAYSPYIRTITFSNDLSNMPSNCTEENLCFDITESGSSEKVYGYLVDSGLKDRTDNTKKLYNLYIVSNVPIFAPSNCYFLFAFYMTLPSGDFYNNLVEINFNGLFNTSNATNMRAMFAQCDMLTSLDLSSFNTSNATSIAEIIAGCRSIVNIDLSNFNTSNVTDMTGLFWQCNALESVNISSFNTISVINMYAMFCGCSSLENLNLSSFNTLNVTSMSYMFYGCSSLTNLDLSNFNTLNVTDMSYMFHSCSKTKKIDLHTFNTINTTNMRAIFAHCNVLTNLDLSNFNLSKVTNMAYMFYYCSSLNTSINITSLSTTSYEGIFIGASTNENSKIIVNYISETSTLVDNMIQTKSSNSNVVKGIEV